ncbi:MAG TPA: hypothetical protein VFS19_03770 [Planctomycetota bacterium]|nr:hypothetical protein [Planctomycetota bacterium]
MNTDGGSKTESPLRALLWGALAAVLGVSLVVKAVDAHGRNAALHRRLKSTEAELERIQADQGRMRAELKALNEDPLYLDSMMQRTAAGNPREPVVEK